MLAQNLDASRPCETTTADRVRERCLADPLFAARYDGWHVLGFTHRSIVVRTHLRDAGSPVALKVTCDATPSERRLFRSAAQATMRVVHPSVLRTFAVFDRGALLWVELELIEGVTLDAALAQRSATGESWTIHEALDIAASLAEAVAAVHAAGYLHLDVKPGNVLVPRDPHWPPKLGDFGLARSFDATVDLSDALYGSPAYLCPEAQAGQPTAPARDVYALAITLYQLFSGGEHPYELGAAPTLFEVQACHRASRPLPLRVYSPDVPLAVVEVIEAGLAKDPRQRPRAGEMAGVLRAAQGRAPQVLVERPSRFQRVSLMLAGVLGGILLTCGVLVVGILWFLLR